MTIALHTDYRNLPPAAQGCVLAIGNFDGVHPGHRAVIGAGRQAAQTLGAPLGLMTFEPHPRAYFKPDEPIFFTPATGPDLSIVTPEPSTSVLLATAALAAIAYYLKRRMSLSNAFTRP